MKILLRPTYIQSEQVRFAFFKADIERELQNYISTDCKLLDIGCYQDSFKFQDSRLEVYGIDKSIPQGYDLLHFKQCDLDTEDISFDDQTFDFIIAGEIIEHIKRPFEFIENLSRLLKPNGIIYVSTPTPYYYIEIFKELFGSTILDDAEHLNLFSPNHLVNYCKKKHLVLLKRYGYKFWIPFIKLMIVGIGIPRFLSYQVIYKFKKIID